MEIWNETLGNKVYLDGASDWSVSATYTINGEGTPINLAINSFASGQWTANLPYILDECDIVVTWLFTIPGQAQITKKEIYTVITPYLRSREILEILPNATPQEVIAIEAATRHIINAHCGQEFGKRRSKRIVRGTGANYLSLPARLISTYTFNGVTNLPAQFVLSDGGWWITTGRWGVPNVKGDYYGLHEINGVVYNPDNVSYRAFAKDRPYEIDGLWGWITIPEAVKEAAKLLVNDYACGDSVYRDRYIYSMTAADWRIQFASGAYINTGNVRADQLLSQYVLKRGWAVI